MLNFLRNVGNELMNDRWSQYITEICGCDII